MKFFNEKTFGKNEYELAEPHNDISKYSYFVEAVEQMHNIRMMNEGYIHDILDTVKSIYDDQKYLIADGMFAICREDQRLMRDSVKDFCRDLSMTIKEDKRVVKLEHDYIKKAFRGTSTITIPTAYTLYEYTHLDDNKIPNEEVLNKCIRGLYTVILELRNSMDVDRKRNILDAAFTDMWDDIHSNSYYNKTRGLLLRTGKQINQDEFPGYIFDFFRNGGKELDTTFGQKDIMDIQKRFESYDRMILPIRNKMADIQRLEDEIFNCARKIEIMSNEYLTNEKYVAVYNKYLALLQSKVYSIEGMIIYVLCGRLDAIAKSYTQDRNILDQVVKMGNTGGDEK